MTLQQQAYKKIDQMSEDGIKFLLDLIDKMDELSKIQMFSSVEPIEAKSNIAKSVGTDGATDTFKADETENTKGSNANDDFLSIIDSLAPKEIEGMSKADKKNLFLQSGGKLNYDEDAYWALRERSMV